MEPTILLIEDDFETAQSYASVLMADGYEVLPVHSRDAGAALLETTPVHAIVMDYWMDGMPATAFLERVQSLQPMPPVIVISALPSTRHISRSLSVAAYLQKPVDVRMLTATVGNLLDARLP